MEETTFNLADYLEAATESEMLDLSDGREIKVRGVPGSLTRIKNKEELYAFGDKPLMIGQLHKRHFYTVEGFYFIHYANERKDAIYEMSRIFPVERPEEKIFAPGKMYKISDEEYIINGGGLIIQHIKGDPGRIFTNNFDKYDQALRQGALLLRR